MVYYVIELDGLKCTIKNRSKPTLVIGKSFRKSFLVILSKNRLPCEPLGLVEKCLSVSPDYLLEAWRHRIRFQRVNCWTSEEDYVSDKLWFFISPIISNKLDKQKLTFKVLYNYVREKKILVGFSTTIAVL